MALDTPEGNADKLSAVDISPEARMERIILRHMPSIRMVDGAEAQVSGPNLQTLFSPSGSEGSVLEMGVGETGGVRVEHQNGVFSGSVFNHREDGGKDERPLEGNEAEALFAALSHALSSIEANR